MTYFPHSITNSQEIQRGAEFFRVRGLTVNPSGSDESIPAQAARAVSARMIMCPMCLGVGATSGVACQMCNGGGRIVHPVPLSGGSGNPNSAEGERPA